MKSIYSHRQLSIKIWSRMLAVCSAGALLLLATFGPLPGYGQTKKEQVVKAPVEVKVKLTNPRPEEVKVFLKPDNGRASQEVGLIKAMASRTLGARVGDEYEFRAGSSGKVIDNWKVTSDVGAERTISPGNASMALLQPGNHVTLEFPYAVDGVRSVVDVGTEKKWWWEPATQPVVFADLTEVTAEAVMTHLSRLTTMESLEGIRILRSGLRWQKDRIAGIEKQRKVNTVKDYRLLDAVTVPAPVAKSLYTNRSLSTTASPEVWIVRKGLDGHGISFESSLHRGRFLSRATYNNEMPTGMTLANKAVGDFNGDGKADVFSDRGNGNWNYYDNGDGAALRLKYKPRVIITPRNPPRGYKPPPVPAHMPEKGIFGGKERHFQLSDLTFGNYNGNSTTDIFAVDDNGVYVFIDGRSRKKQLSKGSQGAIAVGDFNRDGLDDLIRNSRSWQVLYNGQSEWKPLKNWRPVSKYSYPVQNILFGDFDGDKITDAITYGKNRLWVSNGSRGMWKRLPDSPSDPNLEVTYVVGRFDDDDLDDIFLADGKKWYVLYGAKGKWKYLNGSGHKTSDLRFGDFDGDGVTDVLAVSGCYHMSYGGKSVWNKFGGYRELIIAQNDNSKMFKTAATFDPQLAEYGFDGINLTQMVGSSKQVVTPIGQKSVRQTVLGNKYPGDGNSTQTIRVVAASTRTPQPFNKKANRPAFANWLKSDLPEGRKRTFAKLLASDGQSLTCDFHSRRGYNVLGMHPVEFGKKRGTVPQEGTAIFEEPLDDNSVEGYRRGELVIPKDMIWEQESDLEAREKEQFYFSESDVVKSSSWSVNVSAGAGKKKGKKQPKTGGKASVGYQESTTRRNMESTSKVYRAKRKWASEFWLVLNKEQVALSAGLTDYLENMDPLSEKDWDALFDKYGTHYALSSLYGGLANSDSFVESSSVAKSLAKQFAVNASAEGAYKGVEGSVAVNYQESTTSSNRTDESESNENTRIKGLSGGNFETASAEDRAKYIPIKVDLRPIYDVLWPELIRKSIDRTTAAKIDFIRDLGAYQLYRYQKDYARKIVKRDLKPIVFEIECIDVKVTKATDKNGADIELFGDVIADVSASSKSDSIYSTDGKQYTNGNIFRHAFGSIAEKDGVSRPENYIKRVNQKTRFSILPVATEHGVDPKLDRFHINLVSRYYDWDPRTAFDEPDLLAGSWKFSLDDFNTNENVVIRKKLIARGDGAGELEINFVIKRIDYAIQEKLKELPNFPGLGGWRSDKFDSEETRQKTAKQLSKEN